MPRNSDEAIDWPDENNLNIAEFVHRIELAEETHFDSNPQLEETQCLKQTKQSSKDA